MIPRYQTILFIFLLTASVVMGVVLWQLRNHAHERLLQGQDSTPTQAPLVAPAEQATLMVANDKDDNLVTQSLTLPLPQTPSARARAILGKLLDLYAAPDAVHPVPGGATSIAQVFLLPAPAAGSGESESSTSDSGPSTSSAPNRDPRPENAQNQDGSSAPELAVVNFTSAFAASHPSGIETESLTLLSICATLHANLPRVTQVRFLVDGKQQATLAGHADLTRTYLTTSAEPGGGREEEP